jgi:hypothetical protein
MPNKAEGLEIFNLVVTNQKNPESKTQLKQKLAIKEEINAA